MPVGCPQKNCDFFQLNCWNFIPSDLKRWWNDCSILCKWKIINFRTISVKFCFWKWSCCKYTWQIVSMSIQILIRGILLWLQRHIMHGIWEKNIFNADVCSHISQKIGVILVNFFRNYGNSMKKFHLTPYRAIVLYTTLNLTSFCQHYEVPCLWWLTFIYMIQQETSCCIFFATHN